MEQKVFQFDSVVLDGQLKDLFIQRLQKCCSFFEEADVEHAKPELHALVNLAFWYLSIWRDHPTPGMAMHKLTWSSKWVAGSGTGSRVVAVLQKLAMLVLMVGVKYLHERLRNMALRHDWDSLPETDTRKKLSGLIKRLESLVKICSFVNLLVFLYGAKYPSLVYRLSGYDMASGEGAEERRPNYTFMNRQVVWEHLMKLVLVAVPFVDWSRMFQAVSRSVRMSSRMWTQAVSGGEDGPSSRQTSLKCVDCGADPAKIPYQASCGHMYCYYCFVVATNQPARSTSRSRCIHCGQFIESGQRYRVVR